MIFDDADWFPEKSTWLQSQKRAHAEYALVVDEMQRIYYATPVKSEFEEMIDSELSEFVERVGLYDSPVAIKKRWKSDKEMYEAFWNERLN